MTTHREARPESAAGTPMTGKVALVVGASRGIGAAAARAFARAGAAVVLASRDEQAMHAVAGEITDEGGAASVVPADIGDAGAAEHLVERTLARYGRLDAAFNNAGISGRMGPLADLPLDDFDAVMQVNLRGTFLALKYQIPAMLARGGGAIVNMASTAGIRGAKGLAAYTASKHGIVGLTKAAALDYAQHGVRVNVVAPGPVLNDRIATVPEQGRQQIANAVPMRRIGGPDEVAALAVWLCTDQASFITGTVVSIDGGQMAGIA